MKNVLTMMVFLLSIFLGLSGCAEVEETSTESSTGKFTGELEESVIIRVLENDTAIEQGYLKELLDAFNKKYESQGIVAIDANMDQYSDLENDGPYGYGPDVLYQANDSLMKYVDGKHILPLPHTSLDSYNHISDVAWRVYTAEIEGTSYVCGVPVNIQGPLLYYRKDLLPEDWKTNWDKNNNDIPDMVENWNDMYKYSKEVKESSNGEKYGYMKSLFDVYFSSGYLFSYGGYVFGDEGRDNKDIGFANGDAKKGANIVRQLASVMNEEAIDDTITKNAYSKLANGEYFATMTTPDVYSLFIKELKLQYISEGLSDAEAETKAKENLIITDVPMLPKSGDLAEENPELMPCIMMGGVNGYAISSYTKAPNAALAFVDFATSYEMINKRMEILQIVPAREDVASKAGGLTVIINENLANKRISVMPSIKAVAQIWTPMGTFFADIAQDPFRKPEEQKYATLEKIQEGLEKVNKNIYDAIHTLR